MNKKYRKYALVSGAVVVVASATYAYRSDALSRSKRFVSRLRDALQRYTEAFALGGDICATVMKDLQRFVDSNSDEIPLSLQQVAKLVQSDEFTESAKSMTNAIYRGFLSSRRIKRHNLGHDLATYDNRRLIRETSPSGTQASLLMEEDSVEGSFGIGRNQTDLKRGRSSDALDRVLEALLSDRGHSLVSVAVSMGAKNLVSAYVETTARQRGNQRVDSSHADITDKVLSFLCTDGGQQLAVMAIAAFASNGMRVYMDKSLNVNLYDDMFSAMSKPEHLEAVKQCVGTFARDVVATYLKGGITVKENNKKPGEKMNSNINGVHNAFHDPGIMTESRTFDRIEEVTIESSLTNVNEKHLEETAFLESMIRCRLRNDELETGINSNEASAVSIDQTVPESPESVSNMKADHINGHPDMTIDSGIQQRKTIAKHFVSSQDDLDSDSLLHIGGGRKISQPRKSKADSQGTLDWIKLIGKECLTISHDANGRKAMAAIAGSATKGAVLGAASVAMSQRFTLWFMVLCIGILLFATFYQYNLMNTVV